jgi:hypothetical protein
LGSFGRLFVISAKAGIEECGLKPVAWRAWLGEEPTDAPQLKALLAPYPPEEMVAWPVSRSEQVAALLKEAEVAVNHFVEPGNRADTLKLLRLDRNLLEIYAVRGRNMTSYMQRKAELGL